MDIPENEAQAVSRLRGSNQAVLDSTKQQFLRVRNLHLRNPHIMSELAKAEALHFRATVLMEECSAASTLDSFELVLATMQELQRQMDVVVGLTEAEIHHLEGKHLS